MAHNKLPGGVNLDRWFDHTGYYCECRVCGKQWGPHHGHVVGFVVAAAKSHIENQHPIKPRCERCLDSGFCNVPGSIETDGGMKIFNGPREIYCDCAEGLGRREKDATFWSDDPKSKSPDR